MLDPITKGGPENYKRKTMLMVRKPADVFIKSGMGTTLTKLKSSGF